MINIKKTLMTIAGFVLITASPAKADWQFTKWGITPEELRQVSPIELSNGDSNCPVKDNSAHRPHKTYYTSNWIAGSMKFIACYRFVDNKLHMVNLYSTSVNPEAVVKGLSQRYGQPRIITTLQSIGITNYKWDLPNEQVSFYTNYGKGENYPFLITYMSKDGSDENVVRDKL